MAFITADRVRDTSTSTGTGNFTVSGTAPTGFRTLSAVLATSDTFYYAIQHQTLNEWEVGLGTYSSANTFARTTILSSSNAGSIVTFSAGTKDVFITLAATKTVQVSSDIVSLPVNSTVGGSAIATVGGSTTQVQYNSSGALAGSQFLTFAPSTLTLSGNGGVVFAAARYSSDTGGPNLNFSKYRGDNTTPTAAASGDVMGSTNFRAYGGTNIRTLGFVRGVVDTYTSDTNISSFLAFGTSQAGGTAALEKARITNDGNLLIGTSANADGSRLVLSAGGNSRMFNLVSTDVDSNVGFGLKNDAREWTNGIRWDLADAFVIRDITGGVDVLTLATGGNVGIGTTSPSSKLDVSGSIRDSKGEVRSVPQNSQTTAYVLVVADTGKHISITTGGVTVPASVFSVGDVVTIYNNSGSSQTITQGASVTLRNAGTASTGNRTLAQYGLCTVLCVASNTFVISGPGLT